MPSQHSRRELGPGRRRKRNFHTDAFDSTQPSSDAGGGARVGANGRFTATSFFDVCGSLWIGGGAGYSNTFSTSAVAHELRCNGPAVGMGAATVGRNAYVNGDVSTRLRIGGGLYVAAGATVGANVTADAGEVRGPVTVTPPCDCSQSQLIDIAGVVRDIKATNDNALLGLPADALANPPGPRRLDLPCGRYHLTEVTPSHPVTLVAHGRVALAIEGDLDTSMSNVQISIDPQAEIDLFIGGTIVNGTGLALGNIEVPAQLRIYIAGSPVDMSAASTTADNFYLPYSRFSSPSSLNLYGSIFARSFDGQGNIHYDRGVLEAGSICEGTPVSDGGTTACQSCRDCGNQACVGGSCGQCTDSSQCCAPFVCRAGTCILEIN